MNHRPPVASLLGAALLALCLLALLPAIARGQQPSRSLDGLVAKAKPRTPVSVLDTTGAVWHGRLTASGDDTLVLDSGHGVRVFRADEVWEIWDERRGSFSRGFLVGSLFGALLAVAARAAEEDEVNSGCQFAGTCLEPMTWQDGVGMTVFMGAIGGGVALLTRHRTMIYLAPDQRTARKSDPGPRPLGGLGLQCRISF